MKEHRWSGWPGAYCLDCGAEDQNEVCMAEGCYGIFENCTCEEGCEECSGTGAIPKECETHKNTPCFADEKKTQINCPECDSSEYRLFISPSLTKPSFSYSIYKIDEPDVPPEYCFMHKGEEFHYQNVEQVKFFGKIFYRELFLCMDCGYYKSEGDNFVGFAEKEVLEK